MKILFTFILSFVTMTWLVSLMSCSKDEGISNGAPTVSNQSFTVAENSRTGIVVGTVIASDPEMDTLTFSIGSAEVNALAIDETSGALSVLNRDALDYETTPVFTLDVDVSDGNKTATSIITINLTDVPEYALQFDGVDGQVIVPDASELSPTDEITIAMWIRLEEAINCDENDNERCVIIKGYPDEFGGGYNVRVNCDGALAWSFGTENGYSLFGTDDMLEVDTWTFLTFVYDGTSDGTAIYLDGIKNLTGGFDPDQIGSGSLVASGFELRINELNSVERPYLVNFPGSIDDLSLWNVALDANEIANIKIDGILGTESGLVGYWSCNAGSGTKVADQVSGNDGTMDGGVDWVAN